jgi:predicted nicotinamide N-methyase
MTAASDFIRAHTSVTCAPLVPEIALHLATEITPIWQATEAWLDERGIEPPFWAFAWPGGQATARAILDGTVPVAGRCVLDFAAGCGIAAIAAALCGGTVWAAEIDHLAAAAIAANAALNGATVAIHAGDVVGRDEGWDLILAGDVFYEAPMTAHILPWLRALARRGAEVLVADPGRAYLPATGLSPLGAWGVPTSLELEDRTERLVTLYRMA